jgi:hypothetical protein
LTVSQGTDIACNENFAVRGIVLEFRGNLAANLISSEPFFASSAAAYELFEGNRYSPIDFHFKVYG